MVSKKQTTDPKVSNQPQRIVDIAQPNDSPADATGRPVIVTNRVLMQDPMMRPPTLASAQPASAQSPPLSQTSQILPASELVVSPTSTVQPSPQTTHASQSSSSPAPQPAEKSSVAERQNTEPQIGSEVNPEVAQAADQEANLEAEVKAQEELNQLIDDKTYFLPIKTNEQRRSRHVAVWGSIVIIILVVAWLDIALDAGFITFAGLQPLTHFFGR